MELLRCSACGHAVQPGDTVCGGCGSRLKTAPDVVEVRDRPQTVVVEPGMSDTAKILTGIAAIVGAVIIGALFYQWGQTSRSEEDLERARLEGQRLGQVATPAPVSTPASQPPIVITQPGASPTVITPTTPTSTAPDAQSAIVAYRSALSPAISQWHMSAAVAESATGARLAQEIRTLKAVEQHLSTLNYPSGAGAVHNKLLEAMRAMIREYEDAALRGTTATTSTSYETAKQQLDAAESELSALSVG